jgi:hypothetical protein
MVPADHICECIAAMDLRVECVMALEKGTVGKRNWFKVFLSKHH